MLTNGLFEHSEQFEFISMAGGDVLGNDDCWLGGPPGLRENLVDEEPCFRCRFAAGSKLAKSKLVVVPEVDEVWLS